MIQDLQPADPAKVGPYRLLGRLGAGGMGRVYVARSPGGRIVAIKVIRAEHAVESFPQKLPECLGAKDRYQRALWHRWPLIDTALPISRLVHKIAETAGEIGPTP